MTGFVHGIFVPASIENTSACLGRGIGGIRALFEVAGVRWRTQWVILVFSVVYNLLAVGLAVAGKMNPLGKFPRDAGDRHGWNAARVAHRQLKCFWNRGGQIFRAIGGDVDVVLDADAAQVEMLIDEGPIDGVPVFFATGRILK